MHRDELDAAVDRLERWCGDWALGRYHLPYANPGELKSDIRLVLEALKGEENEAIDSN